MKDLPDDFKISAAILSLGLSYVRPSLNQDEKERNNQVNESNALLVESTEEKPIGFTENKNYSNEEKTKTLSNDYDEIIQESDKKTQVSIGKKKLNNTERSEEENFPKKTKRKKLNEMSEKSSEKYVKMFRETYKVENEVTSKFYEDTQLKFDNDLQKEIINEKQQKYNEKIKSTIVKSIGNIKQGDEKIQKIGNHARELILKLNCKETRNTDLSHNLYTILHKLNVQKQDLKKNLKPELDEETQFKLNNKLLEELDGEKCQKSENSQVVEMEVDSESQKELDIRVEDELIKEKQPISDELEIKFDSEHQNELINENIPDKGNKKLIKEKKKENEYTQLQLEVKIDPKLQQQQEDVKLHLVIQFEDDSESQNDLVDKFEEKQSMSGIEIKVNNCVQVIPEPEQESCEKIQEEFDGEKLESTVNESVESVEKREQKLNLEKEIHNEFNNKTLKTNKSKIQEKSDENVESFKEKQGVLFVNTQQTTNEKKQLHSISEQNIFGEIKKLFEKRHKECRGKQLKINSDDQLTEDDFQKIINEIQEEIDDLKQKNNEESEKKIAEEIEKIFAPKSFLNTLKHVCLSFEDIVTPIEERLEQICKDYFFQSEKVLVDKYDSKKKMEELIHNLEKTILQDDEIQTEINKKLSTDIDLDFNDVEDKMQEELGDEVKEKCHVEFKGKWKEKKLKDYIDSKDEIQEELNNVRRKMLRNEMQNDYSVSIQKLLKEKEHKDSGLDIENKTQESYEEELDEELPEDSDIIGEIREDFESKLDEVLDNFQRASDDEDSYVDVEGFDEEEIISHEFVVQPVPEFVGESLNGSEEESEEEDEVNSGERVDINIVTEIVEEYVVVNGVPNSTSVEENIYVEEESNALDKFSNTAKGLNSSSEELNTIERKKRLNKKVKPKHSTKRQIKFNENLQEFQKETQKYNFVKKQEEFKNCIENMQNLDEIPLELLIERKRIDDKLQRQFREFQNDFYKIFKQEYDKGKKMLNSDLSTFNEQQQKFYEVRNDFYKIKEDYKSFVIKKFFEDIQQKIDDGHILDIEEFPNDLNDKLLLQIDEQIEKEFAEMESDIYGVESEFKYNIPLEFELEDSSINSQKKLQEKPFDLFAKLHSIHQKKLCEFSKSTTWPQNCLYPSSLLDVLFEDPSEDKPNFIVITLYPIDIGYSLKISMKINEPPEEIFFDYTTDTILEYIEREKLPPDLLQLFNRAEPSIFYSGRVIAEIHDRIEDKNYRVSRILLHPSNESILRDVNQLIADNSSINWTYEKRLHLESQLLLKNNLRMCMDLLPIAGSTIRYQHILLSGRNISLNPLRHTLETDNLNNGMFSSKLPDESKRVSSKMNSALEAIHHILWKFDFRVESIKIIKLYILYSTDFEEFSLLLCMNAENESDVKMRVKINLKTYQLKSYIFMILEILKQRINPIISLFRRYKSDGKSPPRYLAHVLTLLNNKVYEPSHSDISEMIDIFLEMKSRNEDDKLKSTTIPIQPYDNTTDKTKNSSRGNEKANHYYVQNTHLSSTNHLSEKQDFKMLNMNLREPKELNSTTEILPTSVSATKISLVSNPIEIQPILSSPLLITSVSGLTTITPSALSSSNITPSVSNPVTVISLLPSLITVISSVPSHVTVVSSTTSKVSSSEISSIDGVPASKNVSTYEDHNVNIDTELKPITLSNTDHLENLNKNDDYALNLFDNVEHKPTIYDIMKTACETNITESLSSQCIEKTKLIKHVHKNGICLRKVFPNHTVNINAVPQKSILLQRNIPAEQTTTNSQLENSTNLPSFTDLENSANSEASTVTRHSSEDVFDEFQKLFGETSSSINNLANDNVFQETNISASSNTEDYRGLKRKRTT